MICSQKQLISQHQSVINLENLSSESQSRAQRQHMRFLPTKCDLGLKLWLKGTKLRKQQLFPSFPMFRKILIPPPPLPHQM